MPPQPVAPARSSTARAVATFALAGIVALLVVGVATYAVAQHTGTDAAVRDMRRDTSLLARAAVVPDLRDDLLTGNRSAIAAMDRTIRHRVLDHELVRVKIWTADGRIVYSDEHRLIGTTYPLGSDERDSLSTGRAAADVSDLNRPENRFERRFGKLLEVYEPVHTPNGTPLLFETYSRYDAVNAGGRRVWKDFAPIMLGALIGLEALQIPLAWSMAQRLRAGQKRQEVLLQRAVAASDAERRRIASDLHDGVVQDLASVSYSLASIEGKVDASTGQALHDAAAETRRSIRALRSLLVEIYPPSLRDAGLAPALSDLTAPLNGHGVDVNLDLADDLQLPQDVEALIYRTAQEAVRNVVTHAGATRLDLHLARPDHRAVLDVVDDGIGFDVDAIASSRAQGHVGLQVVADLVADSGGTFDVTSTPGNGTTIHVEVPLP